MRPRAMTCAFGVAEGDDVALLKFALRADDAGGEQAAALFERSALRAPSSS